MPLSGMGEAGEQPVYWDFKLDTGRGSGKWGKIAVPSCWEQQGFGAYYYGTQGRGKPDDDPVIPEGNRHLPPRIPPSRPWGGRDIHIVFEAAMTDTTVSVNGQSAGPTHQGGFYRFSYDITRLVKPGRNDIEVAVAKESANKSVNHAERRGDYWTFGGIYRPVWLEARPRDHIAWTAIDARADGSFYARAHLNRAPRKSRVRAQVFDAAGKPVGAPMSRHSIRMATRRFSPASSKTCAVDCRNAKPVLGRFALLARTTPAKSTRCGNASAFARSKSARAMASISMAARSCSRASIATASRSHGPHADARAELRRRPAHQGRQHERGAHVALSTRRFVPRSRR